MSFEEDYRNRSDTEKGFRNKVRKIEKYGFAPSEPRGTGYAEDECKFGMDDLDRIRRVKINNKINKY